MLSHELPVSSARRGRFHETRHPNSLHGKQEISFAGSFTVERATFLGGVERRVHRSFVPCAALGAIILTAGALAAAPSPAPAPAPYTAAQAAQGAKLYAARCSMCHGAKLEGVSAPSLVSANIPGAPKVSDVYAILSTQMPADAPGSLKPAEYAAITAYLLKTNHHPATGTDALTDAHAKTLSIAY